MEKDLNDKARQSRLTVRGVRHRSFLLRLWCIEELKSINWQASLEIPETGVRIGFASLEELVAYLAHLTSTSIG